MKESKFDQQLTDVLIYHDKKLRDISFPNGNSIEEEISKVKSQLKKLDIDISNVKKNGHNLQKRDKLVIPNWDELCAEAEAEVGSENVIEDLFTEEELKQNKQAIRNLNNEYASLHKLDKTDILISALAAIIGGAVDILMVGVPQTGKEGLDAGPLSDFIRKRLDEAFPPDKMEQLANSSISKVPYDAQDNRNTTEYVEGLSAYYHRLLSIGHDPLIGFVVGVFDILTGRMTTIDKRGKVVSQVMENYENRKEREIFAAIAKQFLHLESDLTTNMGLPAPMMGLFNLLQFGNITEEEQTIAEIVQGMYYEGYDFIHFCSLSIPVMLIEVIVRICYSIKRIKEGHTIKESIPVSLSRERNPKLATMLFIGNTGAAAINAGKVYFTKNPMAINYPQWLAFAKYTYKHMKWVMIKKPEIQEAYVMGKLYEDLQDLSTMISRDFEEFSKGYIVVIKDQ